MRGFPVGRAGAGFGRVGGRHGWRCLEKTIMHTTASQHHTTTRRLTRLMCLFSPTGPYRRSRYFDTSSHICREGHTYRGLLHPRAAHPWRPGGDQPRRDWSRPVCRVCLNVCPWIEANRKGLEAATFSASRNNAVALVNGESCG